MGLMDALRKAEKKGKELARRGVEAVHEHHESADDAQRRMRQKMRMYPERNTANPPEADAKAREMEDAQRNAATAVQGDDVEHGEDKKIA
jgi:hypothetical protein